MQHTMADRIWIASFTNVYKWQNIHRSRTKRQFVSKRTSHGCKDFAYAPLMLPKADIN